MYWRIITLFSTRNRVPAILSPVILVITEGPDEHRPRLSRIRRNLSMRWKTRLNKAFLCWFLWRRSLLTPVPFDAGEKWAFNNDHDARKFAWNSGLKVPWKYSTFVKIKYTFSRRKVLFCRKKSSLYFIVSLLLEIILHSIKNPLYIRVGWCQRRRIKGHCGRETRIVIRVVVLCLQSRVSKAGSGSWSLFLAC